ncbi:MAG TPA: BrxA/BrxB family bacilliredoxin [Fibrobacteria bacterium]|nr:BrxA/BrxB family bacilliredoxin [Fibrobacteria bacterium]
MYPEELVAPMRQELVDLGFREWKSAQDVEKELPAAQGVSLVVVNSVCGCSAASARPGVGMALNLGPKPDHLYTVFAGNDVEATEAVREHFLGEPPSSPSFGIFVDGKFHDIIHRRDIQGRPPEDVAAMVQGAIAAARA